MGSPREANVETSAAHRAATLLGGPRGCTAKAAHRRSAAHRGALAARGGARLFEACEGVKQAHPVGGGRISEGARAREADGSPD